MLTNEIDLLLSDINDFIGTFACNRIPDVIQRPAFFVVNTAPLPEKPHRKIITGEHWVAIRLSDHENEYFDSFGEPPSQPNIVEYLAKQGKVLQHSTQMIQHPLSDTCGVYCIDYVRERSNNVSFRKYLSFFTADQDANDRKVVDRVTWQS